jgi:hypothetical protein
VGNGTGIVINGGCTSAQIINNYIGLAADGITAKGNEENGVVVVYSNNVIIGGNNSILRNLISSNGKQGIVLSADPGTPITGSLVIGNYIGTDVTGTLVRGNGQSGIISIFGNNGFFGRANASEGNLISNNAEEGIHFVGGSGNTVYNNLIGVAANGTTAMGNRNGGVFIQGVGGGTNGSNNIVGGLAALQPNTIAYTTGTGVNPNLGNGFGIGVAHNDQGINNRFIGNKIFCNAGLGIDLNFAGLFGGAGVNSPGNGSKTAPSVTVVTSTSTSGTGVNGETIHLYSNVSCISCQGEIYLGTITVASGVWTINHVAVAAPNNNSATATNGTQGTSQFSCHVSLPIVLVNFEAQAIENNRVSLNWTTSQEITNHHFSILRSADGINYEEITKVAGQGTTSNVTNYTYSDYEVRTGTTYFYKLKQVDFNGTSEESAIRSVTLINSLAPVVYPNPAENTVSVRLNGTESAGKVQVEMYDVLGKLYFEELFSEKEFSLDLSDFAPGVYNMVIKSENSVFNQKLIKK